MKVVKTGISIVILALVFVALWLFFHRDQPIVWILREQGSTTNLSVITILNPFRDRTAEQVCESAMKAFREGNTVDINSSLLSLKDKISLIHHESANRIRGWTLCDIKSDSEKRIYYYNVKRKEGGGPLYLTLKVHGNSWQIIEWESWY